MVAPRQRPPPSSPAALGSGLPTREELQQTNTLLIAGCAIGGSVLLALAGLAVLIWSRRRVMAARAALAAPVPVEMMPPQNPHNEDKPV